MPSTFPSRREQILELIDASPRLREVHAALLARPHDGDSAHDLAHLHRVALWTCRLLDDPHQAEEAIAAALLHDFVNVPKNHPDRARASEITAETVRPLLHKAGFAPSAVDRITTAIRQHSYSRGEKPESKMAKALQDADRLEALGAIGIMRCYSTGVVMGARYFHPEDPWARKRALDDSGFSLDHFLLNCYSYPTP